MTKIMGQIIYISKESPFRLLAIAGSAVVSCAIIQLSLKIWNMWGESILVQGISNDMIFWLIIDISCILLLIFLIIGSFMIRRFIIYENGIVPSWRPFKAVIRGITYYIPFKEIDKIGIFLHSYLDEARKIWFLMKDGTLAECEYAGLEDEIIPILAPLLKKKCPSADHVPIKIIDNKLDLLGFCQLGSKNTQCIPYLPDNVVNGEMD